MKFLGALRRRGEARRSFNRFAAEALERIDDGFYAVDREWRILYANHRACAMWGVPSESVAGQVLWQRFPQLDADEAGHRLRAAVASGRMVEYEIFSPVVRRWLRVRVDPLRDGITSISWRDVTERKQAQERLRASEERFRSMLEALPYIAFVLKPDGTMEYWNRGYVEYVGRVITDLAGRAELHHPDDRERARVVRDAGVASGSEYGFEARLRRHDGAYRWHTMHIKPLRGDGAIIAWLGTGIDIDDMRSANEMLERRVAWRTTELEAANRALVQQIADRERAEAALLQAKKMEAIGQLTGGVAHDFNNLLTAVIGCLDVLAAQLRDERQKHLIATALRSAGRGARLTQQLLAFGRRQALRPVVADLNHLLGETETLFRRAVDERIEVLIERKPELWRCAVDPAQFEAAVMNLVMNARDAMPSGGRLSLVTDNVTLGRADETLDVPAGDYVTLAVSDSGDGMTPAVAARAFEPFFTTKDIGKGSGLGLSMVYGFARQSGGSVCIDSAVGSGTRVTLYLPHAETVAATGESGKKRAAVAAPVRRRSILVVEDDIDVQQVTVDLLRQLGHEVAVAASAAEALELLGAGTAVDLLLSDVVMPGGMSGRELAQTALRLRPSLKVLLTSGYSAAGSDGEFAFIPKPYRPAELTQVVSRLLT